MLRWASCHSVIFRAVCAHGSVDPIVTTSTTGRVAIVYGGIDCDCSRWDDRVSLVPANHWAVAQWVDSYMEGAEGPQWWHLSRPSAAPRRSSSRDLALEAFEDGHPHIVYL